MSTCLILNLNAYHLIVVYLLLCQLKVRHGKVFVVEILQPPWTIMKLVGLMLQFEILNYDNLKFIKEVFPYKRFKACMCSFYICSQNSFCVFYSLKHAPNSCEICHMNGLKKISIINVETFVLCKANNCTSFGK